MNERVFRRLRARNDPFSGTVVPRLRHIERDLDAVITDAQSRDWSADRPDQVVFARLAQARRRVRAARRFPVAGPADPVAVLIGAAAAAGVAGGLLWAGVAGGLLWAGGAVAVRPVPLALVAVAGLWAAPAAVAVLRRLRRRWDRDTHPGRAPIDDPYLYAALRRRIETCAAAARDHRSHRRRGAATELEYALDWLSAAQSELPRR
ncbi:hypothetical protein FHR83_000501 [Actinoplanes campanulatus]|uniref:Uncharacterized protein n=1 Tax=Actinoplanes campanulatus TaxID=113559 RepID=A0A7W5AAT4_9ACTN|nr:hypothetical protein [Actinoplanes campanulatus]MBB3092867.1 hypothetical protein [Actinoplanes campanulatus]GGM99543.1 hypothetical protein GCM10010109_04300 [Actinoplanes campanulatus]GID34035.1 hypothetical protein Aca09nite_05410 [Actinoplanes campanulatus]